MATATEIATKALKRINVIASAETPAASDLNDTIDALNAMIASWEAYGLSGDTLPLDKRFEQAIIAMLAVRMSEDFGKTVGAVLSRDADEGWKALQAAFFAVPRSSFERGLKFTGAYSNYGYFFGAQLDPLSIWQPNTTYRLRDLVSNNYNIYECATAGTSAASGGPTGTSDSITDGTITWIWRRVDGTRDAVITVS